MEESAKTDAILKLHRKISAQFTNVGITLQARPRTMEDLERILSDSPGTIRIVKGAYQELEGTIFPFRDADFEICTNGGFMRSSRQARIGRHP